MKDLKVDGIDWNKLDSPKKIKAIIIISSIILIPLMILFILIFSTGVIGKAISLIIGVLFFSGVTIGKTNN